MVDGVAVLSRPRLNVCLIWFLFILWYVLLDNDGATVMLVVLCHCQYRVECISLESHLCGLMIVCIFNGVRLSLAHKKETHHHHLRRRCSIYRSAVGDQTPHGGVQSARAAT